MTRLSTSGALPNSNLAEASLVTVDTATHSILGLTITNASGVTDTFLLSPDSAANHADQTLGPVLNKAIIGANQNADLYVFSTNFGLSGTAIPGGTTSITFNGTSFLFSAVATPVPVQKVIVRSNAANGAVTYLVGTTTPPVFVTLAASDEYIFTAAPGHTFDLGKILVKASAATSSTVNFIYEP